MNDVIGMVTQQALPPEDLAVLDDATLKQFFRAMEAMRSRSAGVDDLLLSDEQTNTLVAKQWNAIRTRVLRAILHH